MRIWDNHNKQWLKPMSITFDDEGKIGRVTAMKEYHTDPLKEGWYDLHDEDLNHISIKGEVSLNENLYPEKEKRK